MTTFLVKLLCHITYFIHFAQDNLPQNIIPRRYYFSPLTGPLNGLRRILVVESIVNTILNGEPLHHEEIKSVSLDVTW